MSAGRFDALVVGSGPNGLSAAITLAEAGRSVLVLEAAGRPGGAVISDELTLPGFRHDVFSAVYPAGAASPVFSRMPLERHGLRWVHPRVAMAHPMPDGRAAALHEDLDRTAEGLDRLEPGDGGRWKGFAAPYLRSFGALRSTMLSGFPPVGGGLKLLRAFGLDGSLEFARLLLLPASALAGELFRGGHAPAWLYGAAMHGDAAPEEAGSAISGAYLNLLGHAVGWPSPEGGAGRFAAALVGYLDELGGKERASSPVERVLVERGRVRGVVANGEEIRAGTVICDTSPHALLRLAGGAFPPSYASRLARFRYGPQTIKVDWALDGPVPWEAEEARGAGTVHVGGDAGEISRAMTEQRMGRLPERPFLLFGQQSLADPTRAPAGKHTAWAYTRVPRGMDWEAEKGGHVERMEAQVERFAPGFRGRILARHVLAPPGLEDLDRNLVGGDVGGGSYGLDQLVFRPVPSLSPYRTPVRGLYLGSASTFPGGAVHGVPGHAAARLAVFESRLRSPFR